MGIAIIQLMMIILLNKQKSHSANQLTHLLLEPGAEERFLRQLKTDSEADRIKKINQQYAVGLANSVKIAKAVAKDVE
ncbi:hypothetical protein [Streptococcus entericus]|uniref:hypothetical protein n=1 Tax=Streptococcus entericus TaxID=155680 RepID=UPI0014615123|nr:hypothetical protein [Streptococcus entericus]